MGAKSEQAFGKEKGGIFVSDEPGAGETCQDSFSYTLETEFEYIKLHPTDQPCPKPTAVQEAQAALDAKGKFADFAATFCAAGKCADNLTCTATVSDLRARATGTGENAANDNQKNCYVKIEISASISCKCAAKDGV